MNSGAPASTAPPDFSSLGMMASHRNVTDAYCEAEKYLGAYFPAGAAAFSLCTIWWMYSAASAGMTCSTEPAAAPTARVRRMSRRLMDSLGMVDLLVCDYSLCQDGAIEERVLRAKGARRGSGLAALEMTGK